MTIVSRQSVGPGDAGIADRADGRCDLPAHHTWRCRVAFRCVASPADEGAETGGRTGWLAVCVGPAAELHALANDVERRGSQALDHLRSTTPAARLFEWVRRRLEHGIAAPATVAVRFRSRTIGEVPLEAAIERPVALRLPYWGEYLDRRQFHLVTTRGADVQLLIVLHRPPLSPLERRIEERLHHERLDACDHLVRVDEWYAGGWLARCAQSGPEIAPPDDESTSEPEPADRPDPLGPAARLLAARVRRLGHARTPDAA